MASAARRQIVGGCGAAIQGWLALFALHWLTKIPLGSTSIIQFILNAAARLITPIPRFSHKILSTFMTEQLIFPQLSSLRFSFIMFLDLSPCCLCKLVMRSLFLCLSSLSLSLCVSLSFYLCLSVSSLTVCISVCLSVCLYLYLSLYLCLSLYVCLSINCICYRRCYTYIYTS